MNIICFIITLIGCALIIFGIALIEGAIVNHTPIGSYPYMLLGGFGFLFFH
jgi:hypothetical protein